ALDFLWHEFQMTLQPEDMRAHSECLIGTLCSAGQMHCARRYVELITMPMQHRRIGEQRHCGVLSCGSELQRREADFLDGHGIDPCAQRPRYQLRAQADADEGAP